MDFRVTVVVDVQLQDDTILKNPIAYAKQFVELTPMIYGNHDIALENGQVGKGLTVVSTEPEWTDAYFI